jgi:D-psicose/D-tagatose/L-ribulose 3-epimerase
MLLGINMLLWTTLVGEDHLHLCEDLKRLGYDGVELPVFSGSPEAYKRLGAQLADIGLRVTAVGVLPGPERDVSSPDAKIRAAGLDHIKWMIDCVAAARGEVLCGPFYQPLGVFGDLPPTEEEFNNVVEGHRAAMAYVGDSAIKLAIEPLNRFECNLVNTVERDAELVGAVDRPGYGILYDTFHLNIEEKRPVDAINSAIGAINHVHLSENDRGTPGKGHIPWAETFAAFKRHGYDGWYVIEAFGRAMPEIAATTRVWRDLSASNDEVSRFGHDFLRATYEAA